MTKSLSSEEILTMIEEPVFESSKSNNNGGVNKENSESNSDERSGSVTVAINKGSPKNGDGVIKSNESLSNDASKENVENSSL